MVLNLALAGIALFVLFLVFKPRKEQQKKRPLSDFEPYRIPDGELEKYRGGK